ncbi:MAG: DEAD/DEAH box helicase [Microthrixaceae bacterium]
MNFAELGLHEDLLAVLTALGYEEPTPIQAETIPALIAGRDLLGQAATGTGKTAAFALPILERLGSRGESTAPRALILAPTRELAMQVSEAIHRYGRSTGLRVLPICGGQPMGRQLGALRSGTDIVVATPGRAVDHVARGSLDLQGIEIVVLDEADEMLDMGFAEDLQRLLDATPSTRQTVLFSATLPPRIGGLARQHLTNPVTVSIRAERSAEESARVRQVAYVVPRSHKASALGRILDVEAPESAIVFCRTRLEVDELTETLNGRGYRAEALHGGMDQQQRERVLGRVRSGLADLMIATDVAARGLDIDRLTHVVNFDVPASPETYVHRIGRVGRAGRTGVAITLVEPRQDRLIANIERAIKRQLDVAPIPTVAELRSRRLALTAAALRTSLNAHDELERFAELVDELTEHHDVRAVAAAALRLAHLAAAGEDDEQVEIPQLELGRPKRDRGPARSHDRPMTRGPGDKRRANGPERLPKTGQRVRLSDKPVESGYARLFIGAGRRQGIRAGDLVGSICGETDLVGRQIGAIDIAEHFALVEVPSASADAVVKALGRSGVKGRTPAVRRERRPS